MKILYAIQGTGNGHLSRARDIIPILQKKGELDLLVSGSESEIKLPYEIKFNLKGLSFVFGKNGGIDWIATAKKLHSKSFLKDLKHIPIEDYDLVINDFEPLTAWASIIKKQKCIALSHQSAVLSEKSPQPKGIAPFSKWVLHNYAPTLFRFGFHFDNFDQDIYTPVIRKQIRERFPENHGHYTVYLPAYEEKKLVNRLSQLRQVKWEVFSKRSKAISHHENVTIYPISEEQFLKSFTQSAGVLCGAGFETPAEALFLKKKLMVIPMKGQYEQQCNAAALKYMGVPVIKNLKKKNLPKISDWINHGEVIQVDYPDITEEIIDRLLEKAKTIDPSREHHKFRLPFAYN
ncbi:glycosyltransferase family protein [Flexithrix dorotheae]|uniref:glycosyltransferase family protein n=1 Tax=Flexithrix dorotheae TaxID=70993 RepID=UPI00035FC42E|nr:glycosyltransferase family protein [Flexithrix dorotheae]